MSRRLKPKKYTVVKGITTYRNTDGTTELIFQDENDRLVIIPIDEFSIKNLKDRLEFRLEFTIKESKEEASK